MSQFLPKQPNIIFIQADQLAARQLNCYGSGIDSSPTLDRLAREGRRFDRCYTTCPLCLPNRASFLTGRTPGIHGLISGEARLLDDHPSYADILGAHGYRVGGFGKFHREGTNAAHPRRLDDIGFDEFTVVEDDKRGPYLEWIRNEHPDFYEMALGRLGKCEGWLTPEQQEMRARARAEVFGPLKEEFGYAHMFRSPFPPEVHDTTYLTDLGLDFIRRHRRENADRPFFCTISYVDPHDPYDPPRPYDTMFDAADMPDPLPSEWIEQGPPFLNEFNALNCKVVREQKPELFKQIKAFYHGSVRFMDDQIARVIAYLEETGLKDNTLVVFTTDHGDMMGDHGCLAKNEIHYDGSVRCPLIAWGCGVEPGVSDRLVCALDFLPTFCELGQAPQDTLPPLEGKSFVAECAGSDSPDQWSEVAIWTAAGVNSVVTDDGWRLTRYVNVDQGQMFNLREDPHEQRNLYELPEYGDKRQELLERLVRSSVRPFAIPRYANMKPSRKAAVVAGKES